MSSKNSSPTYEKDVELDAILVHAAMHGMLPLIAPTLSMSPDEVLERAKWLKTQSNKYIQQVADAVNDLHDHD